MFPFMTGEYVAFYDDCVQIDETLDDGYYAVRFVGCDHVFTVHGSELG
jgi:hypothetical protein